MVSLISVICCKFKNVMNFLLSTKASVILKSWKSFGMCRRVWILVHDSIVTADLAEEVQIAYSRQNKLKKGDYTDESSATTESDIIETLKRLVVDLKKSPHEILMH